MPNPVTLTVERDVAVPMRDGTMLYADVVRPAGPGRYPALLRRTPYNKQALVDPAFILRAATAGYAMVTQDVRGRYESEGEFNCIVNERQDGYDTLEWLAARPWCDGGVGMYGTSYNGLTQWQAAMSGHPALKAIVPGVTAADYHKGWTYQGGTFQLSFNLFLDNDRPRAGYRSAEDRSRDGSGQPVPTPSRGDRPARRALPMSTVTAVHSISEQSRNARMCLSTRARRSTTLLR